MSALAQKQTCRLGTRCPLFPQKRTLPDDAWMSVCANSGLMQCSIKLIGAVTWPLRWNSPYPRPTTRFLPICLGEHFHVDFVLLGPIANNLDLDRCGNELPRLPLFENYLLIGLYILRWKGFADPLPHRQIRLVSKPDRVVSDVSRVAVANLRSRVGELARCLPLVPRTFWHPVFAAPPCRQT